jgi:hypothetical protein
VKVFELLEPKTVKGDLLNGKAIVDLAQKLVASLNSGTLPNIAGTWESISENACESAFTNALDYYKATLASEVVATLPLAPTLLSDKLAILKEATLGLYKE